MPNSSESARYFPIVQWGNTDQSATLCLGHSKHQMMMMKITTRTLEFSGDFDFQLLGAGNQTLLRLVWWALSQFHWGAKKTAGEVWGEEIQALEFDAGIVLPKGVSCSFIFEKQKQKHLIHLKSLSLELNKLLQWMEQLLVRKRAR